MPKDRKVKIKLPPQNAEAKYSDFAAVGKNSLGFTLDFGQRMPGGKSIQIVSRVAMSPQHAKLLKKVLEKNIEDYEDKFGDINLPKKGKASTGVDNKVVHFVKT